MLGRTSCRYNGCGYVLSRWTGCRENSSGRIVRRRRCVRSRCVMVAMPRPSCGRAGGRASRRAPSWVKLAIPWRCDCSTECSGAECKEGEDGLRFRSVRCVAYKCMETYLKMHLRMSNECLQRVYVYYVVLVEQVLAGGQRFCENSPGPLILDGFGAVMPSPTHRVETSKLISSHRMID